MLEKVKEIYAGIAFRVAMIEVSEPAMICIGLIVVLCVVALMKC
jgi:hypothetical protein